MRILLISLPAAGGTDEPLFPLGIGYLVAVLKQEHEVRVAHYQKFGHVSATLPRLMNSFSPDLVGLTCTTFNRGNVRQIIAIIRKYYPRTKIVVGGVHASFLYEQVINNYGADFVVIGEGEYTSLELCRALEKGTDLSQVRGIAFRQGGTITVTQPRPPIENLDELPIPDFDWAAHLMKTSGMGFMIASRGCPVRCIFCSTSSYWGQKVRKNSVKRVVDEMEHLVARYGVRKIFFHDDTFNLGIDRVRQICQEIMRRGLKVEWAVDCRVTPASQEMVDMMVEAGCRHICWGVETGSPTMLRKLEKKITLEQIRSAYEYTRKHSHILSSGAFAMVGSPGETDETVRETVEFFNSLPLTDHPSTATLCLLPGTNIDQSLKSRGMADDSIWVKSDEVPRTGEHSESTLQKWAKQVADSGLMLPFDRQKHFWNNVLFGDVPPAREPEFLIGKPVAASPVTGPRIATQAGSSPVKTPDLPIDFFTIVLNGEPFIRHHMEVFRQLPFKWHWHIIEGVADLKHDTAWSLQTGGRISGELHRNGRSNDGTTEYLDELAKQHPANITVYRKPEGTFWDGKLEMVNAPLPGIKHQCLLWQVDADELWTKEQICAARDMFIAHPQKTAAYYLDHFFVGERLVTTTINTYGNNTSYEWLRTWQYKPGYRWTAHEPPRLCMPAAGGGWVDVAYVDPLKHNETREKGLVFQHFAYATEKQLRFKEVYYGYKNAVSQWRRLQQQRRFPVFLRDYFAWVNDGAQVNTVESQGLTPLAVRDDRTQWHFASADQPSPSATKTYNDIKNILWSRTDSIGDLVLASSTLAHLRKGFPGAKITALCQEHIAELLEMCPYIDSIITIPTEHKWKSRKQYDEVIAAIRKLQPDLLINGVYSEHILSDIPGLEFIPRRVAHRNAANAAYTDIIKGPEDIRTELSRHVDMLRGLGLGEHDLQPVVWTSDADERMAEELFKANGLCKEKTIALFAGARDGIKTYSGYGKAIAMICKSRGYTLLALGGKADAELNQKNIAEAGVPSLNLSGKLTLRQSAAVLRRCGLAIGTDTSLAHIACAVGIPNVILLGGGHFGRFLPYSPLTSVVTLPLACFGCDWQCRNEKPYCIQSVAESTIAEAVTQTLDRVSNKPRIFLQQTTGCGVAYDESAISKFTANYSAEVIRVDTRAQVSRTEVSVKSWPKISIVTPSFNQAKYLEACMRSILEQGYPNLEYIVVDGGSTDGSVDIIRKCSSKLHWWVSEPDQGQYQAIMKGFAHSSGQIMAWLNSDDMLHPGALGVVAEIMGNGSPVEWLMGGPTIRDRHDRTVIVNPPIAWTRARYLSGNYRWIQQESSFWSRSLWERAGGMLDTRYSLAADMELWMRFFRHARFFTVNALLGGYRYHGDQKTGHSLDKYLMEGEEVLADEVARFLKGGDGFLPPAQPVVNFDMKQDRFVIYENTEAQSDPEKLVRELSRRGQDLAKAGNIYEAIEQFIAIVPHRPGAADLFTIIGNLYQSMGHLQAAQAAFSRALGIDPSNASAIAASKAIAAKLPKQTMKKAEAGCGLTEVTGTVKPSARTCNKGITPEDFDRFTFSRKSHITALHQNEKMGPDSTLKDYQDLLVLNFILDNVPPGSRLLEVGGGESRIIKKLQSTYECWNIDKLEGCGNGPKAIKPSGHKLVRDYMGNFNRELPDNYFDLVFSISALEHVPEEEAVFRNICLDIDRVLKPGGYSLHLFDVVLHKNGAWTNKFVPFIFEFCKTSNQPVDLSELFDHPDLWAMGEKAYNLTWAPIVKKTYAEHGKPASYNVLWQKQGAARPEPVPPARDGRNKLDVLVSAIVSTYKSERYIAECIEDLERQTIADRLEIIVVDSGSPENEGEIVRRYQQRYSNIKYIRTEQRESVYQAWNRGIKAATGKYITNANTDDRHYEHALATLARALEDNPDSPAAYARFVGVREQQDGSRSYYYDSPSRPFKFEDLLDEAFTVGPQPMWRRSIHSVCGYFDEGLVVGGDEEFWFRIAQHGDLTFVDEVLGEFLENPESVCHDGSRGATCFESTYIRKCYRDLRWRGLSIGPEGLTGSTHDFIKDWHVTRLVKRNFAEKFGLPCGDDIVAVHKTGSHNSVPALSTIVYADGSLDDVRATLSAMASSQDGRTEIILVGRHAPSALLPYTAGINCDVTILQTAQEMGPAFTRNAAYPYARASLLAFVDAGLIPGSGWVGGIIGAFGAETTLAIRGRIKAEAGAHVPDVFDLGDDPLPCALETPQFCAVRKTAFEMGGGFNALSFAEEGIELAFMLYQQSGEIDSITYRPDICSALSRTDMYADAGESVNKEAMLTLKRRFPYFEAYYTSVSSLYPWSNGHIDADYYTAFNTSLILKKAAPFAAIRWAQRAVELEPLAVRACFVLGSLYAKGGKWQESVTLLERVLTLSRGDLAAFSKAQQDGCEEWVSASACYVNAAALLAQSFFRLKQVGKARTIYAHLLDYKDLYLTGEQRQSFTGLLGKLRDVRPEPVDDGLAGVPPEVFARAASSRGGEPEVAASTPVQSYDGPLVSAIVSTYNSESFIRGCLEDLERQTIADRLEIIVINSGSQEGEETIVREFQDKYDNIRYIKTEREGLYAAWNRAIKVARGQYLTNANTDDRHRADAFEIMTRTLEASPDVALVWADQITTDTANASFEHCNRMGEWKWEEYSHERLKLGCCVGSQPMWRTSVHDEVGCFDETLTCAGDWDMWLRIAEKHSLKHIPEFLGAYYHNEKGIEHGSPTHSLYERYIVGKRYGTPYIGVIPFVDGPQYPLVSILMAAYNDEKYIAEAIESVLIQNYRRFELIIVNDGATDSTPDILSRYKDERLRVVNKPNGGLASTRNAGIRNSTGRFIVFVDADDVLPYDYVLEHMKAFQANPAASLVYCDHLLIDEQGRQLRELKQFEYTDQSAIVRDMFRCGYPVIQPRGMLLRDVFDVIGLFDESFITGEDYELMTRFVKAGQKAVRLPRSLYRRRIRTGSLSRDGDPAKTPWHFAAIDRLVNSFDHTQLFPDIDWAKIPSDKIASNARYLIGATMLAMAKNYHAAGKPTSVSEALTRATASLRQAEIMGRSDARGRRMLRECETLRRRTLFPDETVEQAQTLHESGQSDDNTVEESMPM